MVVGQSDGLAALRQLGQTCCQSMAAALTCMTGTALDCHGMPAAVCGASGQTHLPVRFHDRFRQ